MQDEQRTEQRFDLFRFLSNSARFLRRTWWIVVLAAAVGAVLTGIYVRQTYTPQYECHAVLSVHSSNNTVTDIIGLAFLAVYVIFIFIYSYFLPGRLL